MTAESEIEALLLCVCSELAKIGWEGECCLAPGEPPLLSCCEGDGGTPIAWARLVGIRRSDPEDDGRQAASPGVGWELEVEVGAVTCMCDDVCDCAVRGQNASTSMAMAEAGLRGASCCGADAACGPKWRVARVESIGPEAGCGGFVLSATTPYVACCT